MLWRQNILISTNWPVRVKIIIFIWTLTRDIALGGDALKLKYCLDVIWQLCARTKGSITLGLMTVKTPSLTSSDLVSSSLRSSSRLCCCSLCCCLRFWLTVSCRSSSSSPVVRSLWSCAISSALNSSSCSKRSTSSVGTAQKVFRL